MSPRVDTSTGIAVSESSADDRRGAGASMASRATATTTSATVVGAITLVSRVFGFVRVLVVAAILGVGDLGNAFQSSNSMSNVLFELLAAGALSAVLVPVFVSARERNDSEGGDELASRLLTVALVALGALTVVAIATAPWLADLLTVGTDPAVRDDQRALTTVLLVWFLPQTVFYAWGAIAGAQLHARRRFVAVAVAPIANTVVTVGALLVFRSVAGAEPGLDLDRSATVWLGVAGTGGVLSFVGVIVVAARRAGSRLGLRRQVWNREVASVLASSAWGVALHTAGAIFLFAAMIGGNSVAGGAIAYQTAFVFFLAPYAVLAQPIQTVVHPELSADAAAEAWDRFAERLRQSVDRTVVVAAPVAAIGTAVALPAMSTVAFGASGEGRGAELIAAALASLLVGVVGYSLFLLLARASFALGDAKTPAIVAIGATGFGALLIAAVAPQFDGNARVAVLGLSHSMSYALGAGAMVVVLRRRLRRPIWSMPRIGFLVAIVASTAVAVGVTRTVGTSGRPGAAFAVTVGAGCVGSLWWLARGSARVRELR